VSGGRLAGAVLVWPRLDVGDRLSVVVELELLASIELGGSVNASLSAVWWSHPEVGESRNASVSAQAEVLVQHREPAVQMYARTPDAGLSSSLGSSVVVGGQSLEMVVSTALPAGTARDVLIRVAPIGPGVVLDPSSVSVVSVIAPPANKVRAVCGGVHVAPLSLLGSAPYATVNASTGEVVIGPCTLINNDTLDGVSEGLEIVVGGRVLRDAVGGTQAVVQASVSGIDIVPAVTNSSVTLTVAVQELSSPVVSLPGVLSGLDGGDVLVFSTRLEHANGSSASVFDVVLADAVLSNASRTATGAPVYRVGGVWMDGALVSGGNPGGSVALADAVLVLSELGAGQSVLVQWEAILSSDVEAGSVYSGPLVSVRWGSHPSPSESRNVSLASPTGAVSVSVSVPSLSLSARSDDATAGDLDVVVGSVVSLNVSVVLPEARMSDASLNVSVPFGSVVSGLALRRVVSARVVVNGSSDSSPSSVLVSSCSGVGSSGAGVQVYLSDLSSLSVVRGSGPESSWYRADLCVLRNTDRDSGSSGAGEVLEVVLEATVQNASGVSRGASI